MSRASSTGAGGSEATSAVAIIPARLGSTRFPGKVLADRTGKPLIRHVWESTRRAASLARVVIATDDQRVLDVARGFGAEAVMTGSEHPNGTSRLAEAAATLRLPEDAIVVNVQGDEPELHPGVIDAAVQMLVRGERDADASVATVATALRGDMGERIDDPNIVKVVVGRDGCALYFSRAAIPCDRDGAGSAQALRHVGLYVYRHATLRRYAAMTPTPLEQAEKLEQLRALENGMRIAVAIVEPGMTGGGGIDTPEQYDAFVKRVAER